MPQTTYDPDRLKRPLIRVEGSQRGEGKYRVTTWEEALDYVAERMMKIKEEYGPEAIAFFGHGTGDSWFVDFLPAAWGSPNAAKPSVAICTAPRETAAQWVFGRPIGGHEPIDWENARYIVLIGHHIGEDTHNTQLQDFALALKRGAKVVVVDPRFSTAAAKAHLWLPIKPGTDTALLLAWIHVLIYEDLYEKEYVAKYTTGFEELKAHVKDFTPEWAEKHTEIPAETIRQVAREMAAHKPQAVLPPHPAHRLVRGRHLPDDGPVLRERPPGQLRPQGRVLHRAKPLPGEVPHPAPTPGAGCGGLLRSSWRKSRTRRV
ncbi:molybdopterin-dependent oxidoreductase [Thermus scotoductus]|uniref:molybdopterin-dependent oxidoreductase n=1 Tax=Thermus scotoductus TaxID=37636 RepID=UPI000B24300C|nr:molybdopterin-dependent oxidoreductase [Thermus scotoductus]